MYIGSVLRYYGLANVSPLQCPTSVQCDWWIAMIHMRRPPTRATPEGRCFPRRGLRRTDARKRGRDGAEMMVNLATTLFLPHCNEVADRILMRYARQVPARMLQRSNHRRQERRVLVRRGASALILLDAQVHRHSYGGP
ncbi:hypothetical protein BKA93DRAFT_324313 [Sparassis latifolia]